MGPNAMKGRGIGTARGRATIMRGMSFVLIDPRFLLANPSRGAAFTEYSDYFKLS